MSEHDEIIAAHLSLHERLRAAQLAWEAKARAEGWVPPARWTNDYESVLARAVGTGETPVAFQALWDGDTQGWFLDLEIVYDRQNGQGLDSARIATISNKDGDFRLFTGEVPPWPESVEGTALGERLAAHFGVPFYFPSPGKPDYKPSYQEIRRTPKVESKPLPVSVEELEADAMHAYQEKP